MLRAVQTQMKARLAHHIPHTGQRAQHRELCRIRLDEQGIEQDVRLAGDRDIPRPQGRLDRHMRPLQQRPVSGSRDRRIVQHHHVARHIRRERLQTARQQKKSPVTPYVHYWKNTR